MPFLSIFVPTYNRSSFLRVMLEALLPQAAEAGDDVEVWVLDNASPDDTAAVIERARRLGPFKSHRQAENIGPLCNILHGPCELATGEFTWGLGDHNLLRPGALRRVLGTLRAHRDLDTLYVNFRCATYPEHWPEAALGGYEGPFHYVANPPMRSGLVDHWSDLLVGESAFCTQLYAHIVRTAIWREFWDGRELPESHTTGISTYPHTWMLASTVFDRPSWRISEPVLTIFNGAQSWGDPETRARVYFRGLPELIRLFERQGLSRERLAEARGFNLCEARRVIEIYFKRPGATPWRDLFRFLRLTAGKDRYLWSPLFEAFVTSDCTRTSRSLLRLGGLVRRGWRYLFFECRPARWYRRSRA